MWAVNREIPGKKVDYATYRNRRNILSARSRADACSRVELKEKRNVYTTSLICASYPGLPSVPPTFDYLSDSNSYKFDVSVISRRRWRASLAFSVLQHAFTLVRWRRCA